VKIIPGCVSAFLLFVLLATLPYAVYYFLAANVDISEDTARWIGMSIYGVYALIMVWLGVKVAWRMWKE